MTEKKQAANKAWEKPQLTVLGRSRPEEAVLSACKGGSHAGSPQDAAGNCFEQDIAHCIGCSADTVS